MIAYDELVDALATWRSRQGLPETGSDFLGPETPFPQYRVAQPTTGRAYSDAERDVAEEVVYAAETPVEEPEQSYDYDYGAAEEQAEAHDVEVMPYEEHRLETADLDETGPYEDSEDLIAHEEATDANIDAARLAADDLGGMDEVEHYDAETLIAEEHPLDQTSDQELEVLSEESADADYLRQEATAIGVGIDELAPAEPEYRDDDEERE